MKNFKTALLFLLAVSFTVASLWLTNGAVIPKRATWTEIVAEAEEGGYRLISTDALWTRYRANRDKLLVVDTRQEWEYRTGHIEGAVNFPMEPTGLARWRKKGALVKLLGADQDRVIVFY